MPKRTAARKRASPKKTRACKHAEKHGVKKVEISESDYEKMMRGMMVP